MKESYVVFNSFFNMINDLYCFCVNGNLVFWEDMIFEFVEGFWFIDMMYINEVLIDLKGKNLEFFGLSFWYFCKFRECYWRFVGEIVIKKLELFKIKKIGYDLDKVLF